MTLRRKAVERSTWEGGPSDQRCRILAVGVLCALVCAVGRPAYGQQARTASDRVYSGAQARRGESLYKSRCASCHGEELRGDSGPPLMGAEFLGAWGSQALADLVDKILHTMPANDPGTLTRQQSTDIVAHILEVGKFP